MNIRHLWAAMVYVLAFWVGTQATSQTLPEAAVVVDEVTWDSVATRAESVLLRGVASEFALNRLRAELIIWRDEFADEREQNSGRLGTVEAQLAALGEVGEEGSEPEAVAERRAELIALQNSLSAPAVLSQEALARATGLISEIDASIRTREAQSLTERTASPLNPVYWAGAIAAVGQNLGNLSSEAIAGVQADVTSGEFWQNLPLAIVMAVVGSVLIIRSRRWVTHIQTRLNVTRSEAAHVWKMPVSLLQILFPSLGLLLISGAFDQLDILGVAGTSMISAVIGAGWIILLAYWLAEQFFAQDEDDGPLEYPLETRQTLRRLTIWLGIGLGVLSIMQVFVTNREEAAAELAVLLLPVQIFVAILLYRFGQIFRKAPLSENADKESGRTRRIVGTICIALALAAPLLAAAGYAEAAEALFRPAILSLAILGFVVLLQTFVTDLWGQRSATETGPLAPILIGFALLLASLPVLALVWGVQATELLEIWERFRTGFTIGQTTLSPTDFLTAAAVFGLGYGITRFFQGTLSNSVLPRTRLDVGAQNAVVSGVGYVGIMLAVIAGIVTAGIDMSSLAIVAGALSVGIGFGLQNIVSNFVSGIILLIERPVTVGDMIEVSNQLGVVRKISVRSTTIETFDRRDVIVPNADLISGQVTNWTRDNLVGRLIVPVGVAYGTDPARVTEILREIAEAHPMVLLDPPPSVLFRTFGDSSLDFEIRAILRDVNFVMATHSEMNFAIAERFAAEGIEIPFPQRDLWLRNASEIGSATEGT